MLKTVTRSLFLLGIAGLLASAQDKTKSLNTEELEKLMKDEKNLFLLDVREAKEITELGSVKGYVNIPLGELEKRIKEVPKGKVVVTL
ncbi:MAG: hypothetical protein HYZ37_11120 [Candidatus Solibacter usitatus]|nr:hypothetical protein [Candidatus Solibacter usitatus]